MSEDQGRQPLRIEFARPREREEVDPATWPEGRDRFTPPGFLTMGRLLGRRLGNIFRPPVGERPRPPPISTGQRVRGAATVPAPEPAPADVAVRDFDEAFRATARARQEAEAAPPPAPPLRPQDATPAPEGPPWAIVSEEDRRAARRGLSWRRPDQRWERPTRQEIVVRDGRRVFADPTQAREIADREGVLRRAHPARFDYMPVPGGGGVVEDLPPLVSRGVIDQMLGRFASTDHFLAPVARWINQGDADRPSSLRLRPTGSIEDAISELAQVEEPERFASHVFENVSEFQPAPTEAHPLQQRPRGLPVRRMPPRLSVSGAEQRRIAERTELRGLRPIYDRLRAAGTGSIYDALNIPLAIRARLRPEPQTFEEFVDYARVAANEQRGLLQWSERFGRGQPRGPQAPLPTPMKTWPIMVPEPVSSEAWQALVYPLYRGSPQMQARSARSGAERVPLAARILDPIQANEVFETELRPFGLDSANVRDRELLQLLESLDVQDLTAVHRHVAMLDYFYRRPTQEEGRGTQWLLGSAPGAASSDRSGYRTRIRALMRSAYEVGVPVPQEVRREAQRLGIVAGTLEPSVLQRLAPAQRPVLRRLFPRQSRAQSADFGSYYQTLRWGIEKFGEVAKFPLGMTRDREAYPTALGFYGDSELALRMGREPHLLKAVVDRRTIEQQTAPLRAILQSQELQEPYQQMLRGGVTPLPGAAEHRAWQRKLMADPWSDEIGASYPFRQTLTTPGPGPAPFRGANETLMALERDIRSRLTKLAPVAQGLGTSVGEYFADVTSTTDLELLEHGLPARANAATQLLGEIRQLVLHSGIDPKAAVGLFEKLRTRWAPIRDAWQREPVVASRFDREARAESAARNFADRAERIYKPAALDFILREQRQGRTPTIDAVIENVATHARIAGSFDALRPEERGGLRPFVSEMLSLRSQRQPGPTSSPFFADGGPIYPPGMVRSSPIEDSPSFLQNQFARVTTELAGVATKADRAVGIDVRLVGELQREREETIRAVNEYYDARVRAGDDPRQLTQIDRLYERRLGQIARRTTKAVPLAIARIVKGYGVQSLGGRRIGGDFMRELAEQAGLSVPQMGTWDRGMLAAGLRGQQPLATRTVSQMRYGVATTEARISEIVDTVLAAAQLEEVQAYERALPFEPVADISEFDDDDVAFTRRMQRAQQQIVGMALESDMGGMGQTFSEMMEGTTNISGTLQSAFDIRIPASFADLAGIDQKLFARSPIQALAQVARTRDGRQALLQLLDQHKIRRIQPAELAQPTYMETLQSVYQYHRRPWEREVRQPTDARVRREEMFRLRGAIGQGLVDLQTQAFPVLRRRLSEAIAAGQDQFLGQGREGGALDRWETERVRWVQRNWQMQRPGPMGGGWSPAAPRPPYMRRGLFALRGAVTAATAHLYGRSQPYAPPVSAGTRPLSAQPGPRRQPGPPLPAGPTVRVGEPALLRRQREEAERLWWFTPYEDASGRKITPFYDDEHNWALEADDRRELRAWWDNRQAAGAVTAPVLEARAPASRLLPPGFGEWSLSIPAPERQIAVAHQLVSQLQGEGWGVHRVAVTDPFFWSQIPDAALEQAVRPIMGDLLLPVRGLFDADTGRWKHRPMPERQQALLREALGTSDWDNLTTDQVRRLLGDADYWGSYGAGEEAVGRAWRHARELMSAVRGGISGAITEAIKADVTLFRRQQQEQWRQLAGPFGTTRQPPAHVSSRYRVVPDMLERALGGLQDAQGWTRAFGGVYALVGFDDPTQEIEPRRFKRQDVAAQARRLLGSVPPEQQPQVARRISNWLSEARGVAALQRAARIAEVPVGSPAAAWYADVSERVLTPISVQGLPLDQAQLRNQTFALSNIRAVGDPVSYLEAQARYTEALRRVQRLGAPVERLSTATPAQLEAELQRLQVMGVTAAQLWRVRRGAEVPALSDMSVSGLVTFRAGVRAVAPEGPVLVPGQPITPGGWQRGAYQGYHRFQPAGQRGLLPRDQWEGRRVVQPFLLPEDVAAGALPVAEVGEQGGAVVRSRYWTGPFFHLGRGQWSGRLGQLAGEASAFMGRGRGRGFTLPGLTGEQEARLAEAVGEMWDPVERKLYINPYEHPVVARSRFQRRGLEIEGLDLRQPRFPTSIPSLPYDPVHDVQYPRWPPFGRLKTAGRSWLDPRSFIGRDPETGRRMVDPETGRLVADLSDMSRRGRLHRAVAVGSYNFRQGLQDLWQSAMPTWMLPTSTEARHRYGNMLNWRGAILGPAAGAAAFGLSGGDPLIGVAVGLGARMVGTELENRLRRMAGDRTQYPDLPHWFQEIESVPGRVFGGASLWQKKFEARDPTSAEQLGSRRSIYESQMADYDDLAKRLLNRQHGVESTYDAKRVQEVYDHLAEAAALGQTDLKWRPQSDSAVGVVTSRSNERLRAEHLFVIYGKASERARSGQGMSATRPPGFLARLRDVPMGELRYGLGRAARAYSPASVRQKVRAGQWLGPIEATVWGAAGAVEAAPGLALEVTTGSSYAAWRGTADTARQVWGDLGRSAEAQPWQRMAYHGQPVGAPSRVRTLLGQGPRALGPAGGVLARRLGARAAGGFLLPLDIFMEAQFRALGTPLAQAPALGRAARMRDLERQLAGEQRLGYLVSTAHAGPSVGQPLAQNEIRMAGATAPLGAWTGVTGLLGGALGGLEGVFGKAVSGLEWLGYDAKGHVRSLLREDPRARGLSEEQERQLFQAALDRTRTDYVASGQAGDPDIREAVSALLDEGFHAGARPLPDTWKPPSLRFLGLDVSDETIAGSGLPLKTRLGLGALQTISRLYMQVSGSRQVPYRPQDYVVAAHDPDFYAYREQGGTLPRAQWHRQNEAAFSQRQLATGQQRQDMEDQFHRQQRAQGFVPGAVQGAGDWLGDRLGALGQRMEVGERLHYYLETKPPIERIPGHQFIPWELRGAISQRMGWHTRGDWSSEDWAAMDRYDLRLFNTAPPLSGFFAPMWAAQQAMQGLGSRRHTQTELRRAWVERREPFPQHMTDNLAILRRQERVPSGPGGWLARNVPGVAPAFLRRSQYEYLDPDTRLPGSVNDPSGLRYDPSFTPRVKRLQQGEFDWRDPQDYVTKGWLEFHQRTFDIGQFMEMTVGAGRKAFMEGLSMAISGQGPAGGQGPFGGSRYSRPLAINALYLRMIDADTSEFLVPIGSEVYSDADRRRIREQYANDIQIIGGQEYVLEQGRFVNPDHARKPFDAPELSRPAGERMARQLRQLGPEKYSSVRVEIGVAGDGSYRMPDAAHRLAVRSFAFTPEAMPGDPTPRRVDLVRESQRLQTRHLDMQRIQQLYGEQTMLDPEPGLPPLSPSDRRALARRTDLANVSLLARHLDVSEPFGTVGDDPEFGAAPRDFGLSANERQTLARMKAIQVQQSLQGIDQTVRRGADFYTQQAWDLDPEPGHPDLIGGGGPTGNQRRAAAAARQQQAIRQSLQQFSTRSQLRQAAKNFVRGTTRSLRRLNWRTQDRRDALVQEGFALDDEQGRYQVRQNARQEEDRQRFGRQEGYRLAAVDRQAAYRTDQEYRRWAVEERYMTEDQTRQSRYLDEDQGRRSRYLDEDQGRRLGRLQEDQQFALEELAEEHQERMAAITRRGRQAREDIERNFNRRERDLKRQADRQVSELDEGDSEGRATIRQRLAYRLSDLELAEQDRTGDTYLSEARQREEAGIDYEDAESDLRERQQRTMARTLEDQHTETERLKDHHRTQSARQEDTHQRERERKEEQHGIRLNEIEIGRTEARAEIEVSGLEALDELRHTHRQQDEDLEFRYNERRLKRTEEAQRLELEAQKEKGRTMLEHLETLKQAMDDIMEGNSESEAVQQIKKDGWALLSGQYAAEFEEFNKSLGKLEMAAPDIYEAPSQDLSDKLQVIVKVEHDMVARRESNRRDREENTRLGNKETMVALETG